MTSQVWIRLFHDIICAKLVIGYTKKRLDAIIRGRKVRSCCHIVSQLDPETAVPAVAPMRQMSRLGSGADVNASSLAGLQGAGALERHISSQSTVGTPSSPGATARDRERAIGRDRIAPGRPRAQHHR